MSPGWLRGLGAELDPEDLEQVLALLYERLELRVGIRVLEALSEEEEREFTAMLNEDGDRGAVGHWLAHHVPDRGQIVQEETQRIATRIQEDPAGFVRAALSTLSVQEDV